MPITDVFLITRALPIVNHELRISEVIGCMRKFIELPDSPYDNAYDLLACSNPDYVKCFLKVYQDKGIDEASEYTQRAFKFFGTKGIPGRPNKPKLLPSISTIIPDRFPSQANQSHDDLQDHPQATARTLPPLRPVQGNAANTTSTHAVHDENTRESSPDPLRTFFGYERCDYSRGPSSYAWESPQPSFTAMRITDSRTQAESEVQTAAPRPATPSIAPPARDAVIEGPVKAGMYWRCPHPWCVMRGPDATEEDCEQHMIHEHGRDG